MYRGETRVRRSMRVQFVQAVEGPAPNHCQGLFIGVVILVVAIGGARSAVSRKIILS